MENNNISELKKIVIKTIQTILPVIPIDTNLQEYLKNPELKNFEYGYLDKTYYDRIKDNQVFYNTLTLSLQR